MDTSRPLFSDRAVLYGEAMKRTAALWIALLAVLALAAPAGAQDLITGEPGDLVVFLDLDDIPEGSTCAVHFDNNESQHPGNVAISRSSLEREVENDFEDGSGETVTQIIESDGLLFAAVRLGETGGTSTSVGYSCEPSCPIADALDAGWTPGGDIPCGHVNVPTTTTTTPPPETTTTTTTTAPTTTTTPETTTTTTTPPDASTTTTAPPVDECPEGGLACTGSTSTTTALWACLSAAVGVLFVQMAKTRK